LQVSVAPRNLLAALDVVAVPRAIPMGDGALARTRIQVVAVTSLRSGAAFIADCGLDERDGEGE
jgi:hypothetical protein